MPNISKVGIGKLRSNLANYLNSNEPIAIVRHGQTIGYYVPATVDESEIEQKSLKQAVSKLDGLLQERG
ncbi:MAG: type II toxin-antitoxin system Phd/YefM family antitoxin [Cyanobacteria bacterium J06607_15]